MIDKIKQILDKIFIGALSAGMINMPKLALYVIIAVVLFMTSVNFHVKATLILADVSIFFWCMGVLWNLYWLEIIRFNKNHKAVTRIWRVAFAIVLAMIVSVVCYSMYTIAAEGLFTEEIRSNG